MYILFPQNPDISSLSIGCGEYIPEFSYGVHFDDLSELSKIEWVSTTQQIANSNNELLYVDKNGVVTTSSFNTKPLLETKESSEVVSFVNYPDKFTLKDVLLCKKQHYLNEGYNECYLYEFNLKDFVSDSSTNCDIAANEITMHKDSVIDLKPVRFNYKTITVNVHSLYPVSVHYKFEGGSFKKSSSFKLQDKDLYLKIKNVSSSTNIIYDYQLLLR